MREITHSLSAHQPTLFRLTAFNMKLLALLSSLSMASAVVIAEKPAEKMDRLMQMKLEAKNKMRAQGFFDEGRYDKGRVASGFTACANGQAGPYSCSGVDMTGFLSHGEMGSSTREGNDVWGQHFLCPVAMPEHLQEMKEQNVFFLRIVC